MDGSLWNEYQRIARSAGHPVTVGIAVAHLEGPLKTLFIDHDARMPANSGQLHTITVGSHPGAFRCYLFDHEAKDTSQGRLAAVWGVSSPTLGASRDHKREKEFLSPTTAERKHGARTFTQVYPGRDRGHAFAHTMGGEMDINFFPQLGSVNTRFRSGVGVHWNVGAQQGMNWRELEEYAAEYPCFCFIRFVYSDNSWVPSRLDYGVIDMPPRSFRFFGNTFSN